MDKEILHPSQVQVSFSRIQSSNGVIFYGSDIKCNSYIELRVKRSKYSISNIGNWFFGRSEILSIRLSPNQFSELITSMNMGDGVPGTLQHFNPTDIPVGKIEDPLFHSTIDDINGHIDSVEFIDINNRYDALVSILDNIKMSKKSKEEVRIALQCLYSSIHDTMPFFVKCAKESIDKSITSAKGVIDSFYTGLCIRLGIKSLKNLKVEMIEEVKQIDDTYK